MRKVKKIYPEDRHWFVPDIDDNRKDEKPFRVQLSSITTHEKQRIERAQVREHDDVSDIGMGIIEDVLVAHVHAVENYEVEDRNGKFTTPKNGKELFDAIGAGPSSEEAIVTGIYSAIQSRSALDEGALGNSERPSGLSAPPTVKANSGRASSAEVPTIEKAMPSSTSGSKSEKSSAMQGTATTKQTMVLDSPGMEV